MSTAEIALTIFSFVVLGCVFAALVWMLSWTLEDLREDEND